MAVTVFSSVKLSLFCVFVLMMLAVLVRESNSYPSPPWAATSSKIFTEESTACKTDVELLDLCQRCAKMTRSRQAYPLCCSSDLVSRRWCYDYIHFHGDNE